MRQCKSRPEATAPPEVYYDGRGAMEYHRSARTGATQEDLTRCALELLRLEEDAPKFLLDLGACFASLISEPRAYLAR